MYVLTEVRMYVLGRIITYICIVHSRLYAHTYYIHTNCHLFNYIHTYLDTHIHVHTVRTYVCAHTYIHICISCNKRNTVHIHMTVCTLYLIVYPILLTSYKPYMGAGDLSPILPSWLQSRHLCVSFQFIVLWSVTGSNT